MIHDTPRYGTSGRFKGKGAFPARSPAPCTHFTPLPEVQSRLHTALGHSIALLTDLPSDPADLRVPVAILAASPGAGKSRMARELLAQQMNELAVTYHAPTLALAEEAAAHARELGAPATLFRGRSAPDPDNPDQKMCRKADLVERAARLGVKIRESFCRSSSDPERCCEYLESCAYLAQIAPSEDARHSYMATQYLGLPEPTGASPTLRVVDETFWMQQLSVNIFPASDFLLPRTFLRTRGRNGKNDDKLVAHQADLLGAARAVVDALSAGRSPMALDFTAKEYAEFAALEYRAHAPDPEIQPDQDLKQQEQSIKEAERNTRYVSWFAAVWTCLAEAKERGRTSVERLRMASGKDGPMLHLCRKNEMRHREPLLLLDADADGEILSALDCNILHTSHMVLKPQAEVVQVHDARMTNGSLLKGNSLRKAWRNVVRREVLVDRLQQGGGVLVGASRKVVKAFFEDAGFDFVRMSDEDVSKTMLNTPLHGAHWLWFGGRSLGSNRYRDYGTVIVIGREELPIEVLEDYGRALWGDRAGADLEVLVPDPDGALRMPEIEVPYEMTDGSCRAVLVPCHPDPLIRRVQLQGRELATRQLVERLRLARAGTTKRVVLGCNLPIPGLPVHRLVSWEELQPSRHVAAVIEGLLARGGLRLSPTGLMQDAPTTFTSLDAAKGYANRSKVQFADILAELPSALVQRVRMVSLCQQGRGAQTTLAVLLAGSAAEVFQYARDLWGPLKSVGATKVCL